MYKPINLLSMVVLLAVIGIMTTDFSNSYSEVDSKFHTEEDADTDTYNVEDTEENSFDRLTLNFGINADREKDEVLDDQDKCPDVAKEDQLDTGGDGIGDACDLTPDGNDEDGDEVLDDQDKCPDVAKEDQLDTGGDGIGDACDLTPEDGEANPGPLGIVGDREMTIGQDEIAIMEFSVDIELCDGPHPNTGNLDIKDNTVKYTPAPDTKIVTFTVCEVRGGSGATGAATAAGSAAAAEGGSTAE
jgi:hypothetical protein